MTSKKWLAIENVNDKIEAAIMQLEMLIDELGMSSEFACEIVGLKSIQENIRKVRNRF